MAFLSQSTSARPQRPIVHLAFQGMALGRMGGAGAIAQVQQGTGLSTVAGSTLLTAALPVGGPSATNLRKEPGLASGPGQQHVPVVEPLTLDQDLGAGDQYGAVLPSVGIEVGGASDGPLAAAAVAQAIIAPELPELLPVEWPPGLLVHNVKRMRHNTNRCTHNLCRTSTARRLRERPRTSPASAR